MRNYKVILQYEGTRYQGWQRQASTDNTIQGKLETLLTRMVQEEKKREVPPVQVDGAGRTDAGVHALAQTANFHLDTEKTPEQIRDYMNFYLPEDIAVLSCKEAPERFHSRLNARGKRYEYRVWNDAKVKPVFERRFVSWMPEDLELEAMRRAAGYLTGTHDFKSFTSAKRSKKSTVRTLTRIDITRSGQELRLSFEGDGFLYHMVRILTGTLLETGRGERKPEEMKAVLEAGTREAAGALAPACGLTLMEVKY